MGKTVNNPSRLTLDEVKAAIAFDQPKLHAALEGPNIVVRGVYLVSDVGVTSSPRGPISEFEIEMAVPKRYPRQEPKVYEVGGRIPRHPDRHINPDGDCCVTVWEEWLVSAADNSFAAFMYGPVNEFFLGQYWYEHNGTWPFGERPHGKIGLVQAYADALGIPRDEHQLFNHLRLLSLDWPKGHLPCACGSGRRIRHCHRAEMMALHNRVPPRLAKRMLRKLTDAAQ